GRDIVDLQGNVAVAGRTGNEIQIFSRDTVNGQWFSSFVGTGSDNTQNGFGERVKCWNHTVITSNYNKDAYGLNSVGAVYIFEDTAYYNSNPPIIVGVEDEVINRWDMQIMNPFKDDLSIIVGNHLETSISIFDAKGQLIQEASFINSIDLNTSNWSRGIYYVTLLNTDGYTTKKLVKN
ncbi:MAG: T9SS type A sorting domain-containing protein, partial [Flavobacteriales bacterium]|nr:T9SS type A sorting domain-containing protein [Flavobacteriales bacterium]